jgi:hypothetical protein
MTIKLGDKEKEEKPNVREPSLRRRPVIAVSHLEFEFLKRIHHFAPPLRSVIRRLFPMPNTIDGILQPPIFLLFLFLCLIPSPSSSCTVSPQHFHLSARVSLSNSLRRSARSVSSGYRHAKDIRIY